MIALADTGQIGAKALYLLLIWLASAAGAAWMADRKGYGERLGLTFGLVLTFVGFIIVLLLPGRPGSAWKLEGPLPRRRPAPATGSPPPAPSAPAGPGDPPSVGPGEPPSAAPGDRPSAAPGDRPSAGPGDPPPPSA